MNEQSEHLSNAQIENYGNQVSDAESDTGQHSGNQWVEAHLEDCTSCRERLLDFHRTHFGLLKGSGYVISDGADATQAAPKPANQNFVDPRQLAERLVNKVSTPDCPSTDELLHLAAGLLPDALSTKLTRHAVNCDHCGPLLKAYRKDFSDDFTPEEQAALDSLQCASDTWQKQTAKKMLHVARMSTETGTTSAQTTSVNISGTGDTQTAADVSTATATDNTAVTDLSKAPANVTRPKPAKSPLFWKWLPIPAAAALTAGVCAIVALGSFGVWYARRDTPEKVEKLLAQAVTEKRTMELRWPGAVWSPYSAQRGVSNDKPLSLMQAEIVLESQTDKRIRKNSWARLVAEKEIITGDPEKGIPVLEHAVRLNPNSIPLLLDLAIAYFYKGEQTRDQENYAKSRELLTNILKLQPANTVALFDRALIDERLNARNQAIDEWKAFLDIETDQLWSAEARKRLEDLQDLK